MPALLATGNGCQILIGIETAQADHFFRGGMLAAANRRCRQYFSLEILYGTVLGSAHEPENRPREPERKHAEWRPALNSTKGTADGTQTRQLAGYSRRNRRVRRHLNQ